MNTLLPWHVALPLRGAASPFLCAPSAGPVSGPRMNTKARLLVRADSDRPPAGRPGLGARTDRRGLDPSRQRPGTTRGCKIKTLIARYMCLLQTTVGNMDSGIPARLPSATLDKSSGLSEPQLTDPQNGNRLSRVVTCFNKCDA